MAKRIYIDEEEMLKPKKGEMRITGLGDTIEKITKTIGIKPCGGCKKRRDKLNKLFPYKNED